MLDAAICAYSVTLNGDFHPDPLYFDPVDLAESPAIFDGGKHEIDAGFIGTTNPDPSGNRWVVLSFRGTLGSWKHGSFKSFLAFLDDWLQDDETKMVPMTVDGTTLGCVEGGFWTALSYIWPKIAEELDKVDWTSVTGIQITGHSKGAAMTFLAAAMVRLKYPAADKIEVHAFAAPLAGDPVFAKWYRSQNLDASTMRYQKVNDIVPFVPPTISWNIFHNLPGTWHPEGIAIEAALKLLSLQVYGGYQELGQLVGLVTTDPKNSKIINGAEPFLRNAIRHTIHAGDGGEIAGAHSATESYWPALFPGS
jgi:hypothetical protein